MLSPAAVAPASPVVYPECDGEPMADNSKQFRWIIVIAGNLTAQYSKDPDVYVSGNQLWYPIEGELEICTAPDIYAVFGRPKGDRGSYKQWEEGGIPMTVTFEILSPSNTGSETADKQAFYDDYGVEEYYMYDPEKNRLHGYIRRGESLVRVRQMNGFVSPRLGIRFDLSGEELVIRYPNGEPFLTFEQIVDQRNEARQQAEQARQAAAQARELAEVAEQRATKAEQEAQQAKQNAAKAEQAMTRLRELTRKLKQGQATAEELAELERLLQGPVADAIVLPALS